MHRALALVPALTLVQACAHPPAEPCRCAEAPPAESGSTAAPPAAPDPSAEPKPEVKLTDLLWHETMELAWWKDFPLDRPLPDKVAPAPPELSDYVFRSNVFGGYEGRALPASDDPELIADVRAALEELPERVQALINPKLVGVFLVTDLGSSGFGEALYDAEGRPAAGYVVLDAAALNRTANDWRTWMENSPYPEPKKGEVELVATIEEEAGNNRKNALQYILLHELGHILTIGTDIHPPFLTRFREMPEYRFSSLGWRSREVFECFSPDRERLKAIADYRYYAGPERKISREHLPALYAALAETPFPTLYGSMGDYEDFAESFASYVHVKMLGRPFRIELRRGGEVILTHQPCWGQPACAAKHAYLEALIAEGPGPAPER